MAEAAAVLRWRAKAHVVHEEVEFGPGMWPHAKITMTLVHYPRHEEQL